MFSVESIEGGISSSSLLGFFCYKPSMYTGDFFSKEYDLLYTCCNQNSAIKI